MAEPSPLSPSRQHPARTGPSSSGLDEFTSLLTVEDARLLVNLLKLAVAGRAGERGQETLAAVLLAMGRAKPEVRSDRLWSSLQWSLMVT